MTVYVDDMLARFGPYLMSHMVADSEEELHQMAARIGLHRSWWQSPEKGGSHYDISQTKKVLAIEYGAVQVTHRQLATMNMRRKATGKLVKPADALEWLKRRTRKADRCPA